VATSESAAVRDVVRVRATRTTEPRQAAAPVRDREESPYPGASVDEQRIVALHGTAPLTKDHPHVAAVIEVQERHLEDLMAHPAVVGTAIGLNDEAEIAIIVMTKADAPDLPSVIDNVPVVVRRTGEIFALVNAAVQDGTARPKPDKPDKPGKPKPDPSPSPTERLTRPVPIGVSTGHPAITAGTIGCRVTKDGLVFALSNNHVYADANLAGIGDNVIQPGTYDGGVNPDDAIGTLADFEPIDFEGGDNTIDAAIALCTTDTLGKGTLSSGYGVPKSTPTNPAIGMRVKKFGRTTELTSGRVGGINAIANVNYGDGLVARFVSQFYVDGEFSAGGDSGSCVVVNDKKGRNSGPEDRKPVGLLFAGGAGVTICNDINLVLDRFGVTVDGE
jgi:hypothetical protein